MTEKKKTETTYYKVLHEDGKPKWGGRGTWSLPEGDEPGEWMPPIEGRLIPCVRGYHLCRPADLIYWIDECVFEAEWRGDEPIEEDDKIVVREARLLRKVSNWNENTFRLFACDCVEHATASVLSDEKDQDAIELIKDALKATRNYAREDTHETRLAMRKVSLQIKGYWQYPARQADLLYAAWRLVVIENRLRSACIYAVDSMTDCLDKEEREEEEWQSERLLEYITGKRV